MLAREEGKHAGNGLFLAGLDVITTVDGVPDRARLQAFEESRKPGRFTGDIQNER